MKGSKLPYLLLLAALLLFNALIFTVPFLASQGQETGILYSAFAPTCHQLTSRSLCLFRSAEGYSIEDCFASSSLSPSHQDTVVYSDKIGYKLPVCSRDTAIYLSMLLGLLALPFVRKIETEDWPNKWVLLAAAVPIAIDGTTQLVGLRESDNLLRLITGAIIGVVLPFYLLPMLNSLYSFILEKARKGKKKR